MDHALFLAVFQGLLTPQTQIFSIRHQKGTSLGENASFEPSTMEIGLLA
jgi:hypothetical protein